jgi:hypothetical protein
MRKLLAVLFAALAVPVAAQQTPYYSDNLPPLQKEFRLKMIPVLKGFAVEAALNRCPGGNPMFVSEVWRQADAEANTAAIYIFGPNTPGYGRAMESFQAEMSAVHRAVVAATTGPKAWENCKQLHGF